MAENQEQQQQTQQGPSYEELVKMYNDLAQNRAYEEARTRLAFCLEVMKLKDEFPKEYIKAVAKEIMTILPMAGVDPEKTKKTTKKAKVTEEE